MLYRLLKIPAKLAFLLYCRSAGINHKKYLAAEGPLLIAANHPNSFLDAVIIATLFKRPVYSLTRGDVYKNPFFSKILNALKMLPVYRMSEGVENLEQNYDTFDKCKEIFKKNGIVLIFSEGRCINEWRLRPLKKGTARLAISSWQDGINLKVLPAGINYQSFTVFGKNVLLNFGDIINEEDIDHTNGYGKTINDFNEKLRKELTPLITEADKDDKAFIRNEFYVRQNILKKILLFIPAVAGWVTHAPLFIPVRKFSRKKAGHNDHYDSMLVALLFGTYPLYLLLAAFLLSLCMPGYWWAAVFILMPFFAWSYVQLKHQF